jgi:hypothetical protein
MKAPAGPLMMTAGMIRPPSIVSSSLGDEPHPGNRRRVCRCGHAGSGGGDVRARCHRLLAAAEARSQSEITENSLRVAEANLLAQQRPELIALQEAGEERELHLACYGSARKAIGEVWARVELMNGNVGVISFDARNIGLAPRKSSGFGQRR